MNFPEYDETKSRWYINQGKRLIKLMEREFGYEYQRDVQMARVMKETARIVGNTDKFVVVVLEAHHQGRNMYRTLEANGATPGAILSALKAIVAVRKGLPYTPAQYAQVLRLLGPAAVWVPREDPRAHCKWPPTFDHDDHSRFKGI